MASVNGRPRSIYLSDDEYIAVKEFIESERNKDKIDMDTVFKKIEYMLDIYRNKENVMTLQEIADSLREMKEDIRRLKS